MCFEQVKVTIFSSAKNLFKKMFSKLSKFSKFIRKIHSFRRMKRDIPFGKKFLSLIVKFDLDFH